MKLRYILIISLFPILCQGQVVKNYEQVAEGINVSLTDGILGIYPLSENAVRVRFYKDPEIRVPELIFTSAISQTRFKVSDSPTGLEIKTKNITVRLDRQTGTLSFADDKGTVFLREKENSRQLTPGTVGGEPCFMAEQSFESPVDEHLFGLGQFQDGHYNIKNITRRLTQVNSQISIPFIFSSKGYGLLWHQYGLTDFNPADNSVTLEKQEASAGNGNSADVTTTSGTQRRSQMQSVYSGKFEVPADGVYSLFIDYGDMESRHFVTVDGKTCIDQSNMWLPPTVSTLVKLSAGEHHIQLPCKATNNPKVTWKLVDTLTTFRSPNAKLLDYVVFFGPSADKVIADYRDFSGSAPLFPLWAYGFWQCRERYSSGNELVEAVKGFRNRNIPLDVIVQDWQYWGNKGWGVPIFDETNYSNPSGFIKEIHDLNARFNISIWSNPDKNSPTGLDYVAKNLFIPDSKWLDYFNPVTRETYWNTLKDNLFVHGVDSWWMDATEPENDALKGLVTHLGPGEFYRLTYPLFVSQAVYEGQRETTSDKRVCILTRSAFLGQQKYGIINWSGDIGGTWDAYRRQIVAGLNFTITGLPYWTTDIGGFFRSGKAQYTDEKYHELLVRWYQWGAFNPIFRIHGYQSETEPWKFGPQVENNMREMLGLRYRLLPYIYSEAYNVTHNGSTMMRPLVMDFAEDPAAIEQPYQYMFGKAFLVAPVTEPDVKEWKTYLPREAEWYDFWTGEKYTGGQTVNRETPIDIIPLYVKAGSIMILGPGVQYATEKKWDNLEIRVYAGANGEFALYEDENDNYNYEDGICSIINFSWSDSKKKLTIGAREGSFPGMLKERKFNIVLVEKSKGGGTYSPEKYDKTVKYTGKKLVVRL